MDWMFATRFDPAVVFVFGWGGAAVLDRDSPVARAAAGEHDPACALAIDRPDSPRRIPAIDVLQYRHQLDLRRYTIPNRHGLLLFVPARLPPDARPMACAGSDPGGLLGRV